MHVVDGEKVFPGAKVQPPPPDHPGFQGADKSRIPHLGTLDTVVRTDEGIEGSIKWKNARVAMPILSTHELARRGNKAEYEEDHCYIINKKTGQRTKFFQRDGVYFLELLVHSDVAPHSQVPFGRPG